jgi:hypothetical protein
MDKHVCYDMIIRRSAGGDSNPESVCTAAPSKSAVYTVSTTSRQILRSGGEINLHRFRSYGFSKPEIEPNQLIGCSSYQPMRNELLFCRICF